jgi:4'-phosphopantetheinyl transferase
MEVHAVKLTEILETPVDRELLSLVSAQRQISIKRFYKTADAQRSLYAELLLRSVLRKKGILSDEVCFELNPNGKPSLKGHPDIHYNLSHSGEWVVCAIDNEPVGIDVESIHPIDYGIAERYFSSSENMQLMRQSETDRLPYFFDIWTLKESYIKAIGRGMSMSLQSFSILKVGQDISLEHRDGQGQGGLYSFKQFDIDPRYKLSLCGIHATQAQAVEIWSPVHLITR